MESPVVDKVARRRSAVAILISLLAFWISMEGVDAVCFNFKVLALTTFVTAPLILVYLGAILLLLQTPKLLKLLKNHQGERNSRDSDASIEPQNKPDEAATSLQIESETSAPPPPSNVSQKE